MVSGRRLFVSDIHGQVEALGRLLERMEYKAGQDRLILLGDYVGAGGESLRCLRLVRELCAGGAIALLGNHDQALIDCLASGDTPRALPAIYAYMPELAAEIVQAHADFLPFLRGLPLWYEDHDVIAVHAGFNPDLPDWHLSTREEFTSMREPFLSRSTDVGRMVIFGHTPCERLHGSAAVYFGQGRIGIDGGAGHGRQLNGLVYDGQAYTALAVAVNVQEPAGG